MDLFGTTVVLDGFLFLHPVLGCPIFEIEQRWDKRRDILVLHTVQITLRTTDEGQIAFTLTVSSEQC